MNRVFINSLWRAPALLLTALSVITLPACSSASDAPSPSRTDENAGSEPVYAVVSLTFSTTGSQFTYVSLLDSLDTQSKVSFEGAREFAGYSPAQAVDGKVIVGDGEGPTLTRFAVSDEHAWDQEGTLNFATYSSESLEASVFVGKEKAYLPFDKTNFVVYDPAALSIEGEVGAPSEIPLDRGGRGVWRGYGQELRDTTLFQPYYWASEDFHDYSKQSQISVIDTETDEVKSVVGTECPHLHITSHDDDGNLYFSNGQGSISAPVLDPKQPRNCMVRIKAGEETLDDSFTVNFSDLTGGREGSNFFYIGDDVGFFNVFHDERQDITPETEFATVDYSSNYHLWRLDLKTMEAKMMDGVDYAGGQFVAFQIDGRTFVAIPAGDYSSTEVFEVFPVAPAEKRFDTDGWAFNMFRVR